MIVPRGGKGLVARVQAEARVPVFAHLEGIVHVYVDRRADLDMALAIVSTRRCGAPASAAPPRRCWSIAPPRTTLRPLVAMLIDAGCEVRGDPEMRAADRASSPRPTTTGDRISRRSHLRELVDGVDEAIAHIERYGSHHTDASSPRPGAAERFLREVDSAIVLHNASTQFADGGEFGFGAEIGIATGRMHARGPVGVEQLTTFKYRVRGSGQVVARRRAARVSQKLASPEIQNVHVKRVPAAPARPAWDSTGLQPRDYRIPPHMPGMRIGLFGGTFDPPMKLTSAPVCWRCDGFISTASGGSSPPAIR